MGVPFCPDSKHWATKNDEIVTVSEFLNFCDWNGESLTVVGSQGNDYFGASHLFDVTMSSDLAVKFFGRCRLLSATLYPHNGIRVNDKDHLLNWAKENGICNMDELRARFHEYDKRFALKRLGGPDGYIRIAV